MKIRIGAVQRRVEEKKDDHWILRSQVFIMEEYEGLNPTCESWIMLKNLYDGLVIM
jgi:hypothetical protein